MPRAPMMIEEGSACRNVDNVVHHNAFQRKLDAESGLKKHLPLLASVMISRLRMQAARSSARSSAAFNNPSIKSRTSEVSFCLRLASAVWTITQEFQQWRALLSSGLEPDVQVLNTPARRELPKP